MLNMTLAVCAQMCTNAKQKLAGVECKYTNPDNLITVNMSDELLVAADGQRTTHR